MDIKTSPEKGTTPYRLNKDIEERGKRLVMKGFHNTMSDLVEYAAAQHVLFLEQQLVKRNDERK